MTTPTHVAANLGVFLLLMQVPNLNLGYLDLGLIIASNLIDLDHLFSQPIYDPRRNSFRTHFFHRHWKAIAAISTISLFIRPIAFLGLGILMHYFLDYLYNKREKIA